MEILCYSNCQTLEKPEKRIVCRKIIRKIGKKECKVFNFLLQFSKLPQTNIKSTSLKNDSCACISYTGIKFSQEEDDEKFKYFLCAISFLPSTIKDDQAIRESYGRLWIFISDRFSFAVGFRALSRSATAAKFFERTDVFNDPKQVNSESRES